MSINSKGNWLRGFLASLECSDTISKSQIQLLKAKLNELLEEVEEIDFIEENEDDSSSTKTNFKSNLSGLKSGVDDDDLPF